MRVTRLLYEIFILLVVLTYAILIFADPADQPFLTETFYRRIDYAMITFFAIEYSIRLWRTEDRKRFVIRNWFDLLAMIPLDVHFPLARFMRLVRLVRILHASPLLWSVVTSKQMRLIFLFMMLILAWSSAGIYVLELHHNDSINSFGDALWWAIVTMTTVGYGDVSPATDGGRIIAVFLMFTGIGLIGTFTANLANHWVGFFHGPDKEQARVNRVQDQLKTNALQWMYRIETLNDEEYQQLLKVMETLRPPKE
ncbi:ion transporter [Tumebacillus permanentifrigoris]|uniref:ion transporter n=1 Tax=Tumebacillus permanentifrigoris TaxID=378543 RepID=UPI001FE42465|nr:ion transporter [Tumebacillus permanentifrigoris]